MKSPPVCRCLLLFWILAYSSVPCRLPGIRANSFIHGYTNIQKLQIASASMRDLASIRSAADEASARLEAIRCVDIVVW